MTSRPGLRLAHDHAALDELLKQLQQAVAAGDLDRSFAKLDLFWARLAVHIRAEHHHLFPAVLNRLRENTDQTLKPSLSEAEATVDRLRADHDYFMHELPQAIRLLLAGNFKAVQDGINEIEKRLVAHNEIEEAEIYNWATALFNEQQQMQLCALINEDLASHPPRFAPSEWLNE